jgi:DNA-binding transcriptional LysR family regulator
MTTTIDRVLRSNLKLKHLQLLIALDQFRHLGQTAQFLSVSQPAVSKTLGEIERMFDARLFLRSTKGTEPTATGETVIRFARHVIAQYEKTRDALQLTHEGSAGRVSVGAMVVATPVLLAQALLRFKQAMPAATVLIEEGDLTRLLPRLRMGELDFIVGRLEPGYAAPDLHTEALCQEPMCLICAPQHPLAALKRVGWAQLQAQRWVMPPPWATSRAKLHQLFYKNRLNPPSDCVESASFLVTLTQVQTQGAVGFVARNVGLSLHAQGLAHVLPVALPMDLPPLGLIRLNSQTLSPTAQSLVSTIRDIAVVWTQVSAPKVG